MIETSMKPPSAWHGCTLSRACSCVKVATPMFADGSGALARLFHCNCDMKPPKINCQSQTHIALLYWCFSMTVTLHCDLKPPNIDCQANYNRRLHCCRRTCVMVPHLRCPVLQVKQRWQTQISKVESAEHHWTTCFWLAEGARAVQRFSNSAWEWMSLLSQQFHTCIIVMCSQH